MHTFAFFVAKQTTLSDMIVRGTNLLYQYFEDRLSEAGFVYFTYSPAETNTLSLLGT